MEEIVGYRLWRVFLLPTGAGQKAPVRRRLTPVACGVHHVYEWPPPGEWGEACCSWSHHPDPQAQCPGCVFGVFPMTGGHTWGFYAYNTLEDALRYAADITARGVPYSQAASWAQTLMASGDRGVVVVGTCQLAGKVIVAERGYRATHARITALFGPKEGEVWAYPVTHGQWISIPWPWDWPISIVENLVEMISLYRWTSLGNYSNVDTRRIVPHVKTKARAANPA